MINSGNALEFLKPKLITMDKYNCTTTTKLFPPSSLTQTRTFVTISGRQNNNAIDSLQEKQAEILLNDEMKQQERVRVQHLENHTKLQNNKCWNNFRTLYHVSASPDVSGREKFQIRQTQDDNELDVVNVTQLTSTTTPFKIEKNHSAFNLDLNNKYHYNNSIGGNNNLMIDSSKALETNNNYKFYCKQYNYGLINKQSPTSSMIVMSTEPLLEPTTTTISQRTVDQNNAYRHIESVHNYAKSKSYECGDDDNTSPNGSRHSSYLDDDEDEDDEEDNDYDNADVDYDNDDVIDYEKRLESNLNEMPANLDEDYEDIYSKRRYPRFQKLLVSSDGAFLTKTNEIVRSRGATIDTPLKNGYHCTNILKAPPKVNNNKIKGRFRDEEAQIDVDVETLESQTSETIPVVDTNFLKANSSTSELTASIKPDHHARRPMNAFLIFCKRHRSIVKERYKNLENRAITKILGDWWASLDTNDKKSFTNLAQENKDAFFSANPNFKWYKLPAPPLRTLTTRPANAFGQECQEDSETSALEMLTNSTRCNNNHSNYFKLADEAQMGDLSQLMQDKKKTTKQCIDLQQVLGETSQFMSAHITDNSDALEGNNLKRRFYNENSFSSNSSEEDVKEPKKKSARSCKGKIYQELVNSGQITTTLKKSKYSSTRTDGGGGGSCGDNSENTIKKSFSKVDNHLNNNGCKNRSVFESENIISYDINSFDLEERIKELPALNLDDYLQQKRNTKKKKKFSSNGKKRGQRSNNSNSNSNNNNATNSNDNEYLNGKTLKQAQITALSRENLQQQHQKLYKQQQQSATAVGSQKRKARKESITRRDVSAIEQEVASVLSLTINGCCYFQEAPTAIKYIKIEKDTDSEAAIPLSLNPTAVKYIKIEKDADSEAAIPLSLNPTDVKYVKIEKDTDSEAAIPLSLNTASTSSIIPLQQNSSLSASIDILNDSNTNNIILNDNISSSTSDLLILAEVAANRTELNH